MDNQMVFNVILALSVIVGGAVMATLGWFARTIWDEVKQLKDSVADLRVNQASKYVSKDELAIVIVDIKSVFNTGFNGLQHELSYIRQRVDGIPQRRQSDPPA